MVLVSPIRRLPSLFSVVGFTIVMSLEMLIDCKLIGPTKCGFCLNDTTKQLYQILLKVKQELLWSRITSATNKVDILKTWGCLVLTGCVTNYVQQYIHVRQLQDKKVLFSVCTHVASLLMAPWATKHVVQVKNPILEVQLRVLGLFVTLQDPYNNQVAEAEDQKKLNR